MVTGENVGMGVWYEALAGVSAEGRANRLNEADLDIELLYLVVRGRHESDSSIRCALGLWL